MKSIQIASTEVSRKSDLDAVSTADLLGFYNATTGKSTSKFASRSKGVDQVWTLVGPMLGRDLAALIKETGKAFEESPFTPVEPVVVAEADPVKEVPIPTAPVKEVPVPTAPVEKAQRKARGFRFKFQKAEVIKEVKAGSKRALLLEALQKEGGSTFEECMAATGWNRKDCYEAIRLLHYYVGYGLNQDEKTGKIWVVA